MIDVSEFADLTLGIQAVALSEDHLVEGEEPRRLVAVRSRCDDPQAELSCFELGSDDTQTLNYLSEGRYAVFVIGRIL